MSFELLSWLLEEIAPSFSQFGLDDLLLFAGVGITLQNGVGSLLNDALDVAGCVPGVDPGEVVLINSADIVQGVSPATWSLFSLLYPLEDLSLVDRLVRDVHDLEDLGITLNPDLQVFVGLLLVLDSVVLVLLDDVFNLSNLVVYLVVAGVEGSLH